MPAKKTPPTPPSNTTQEQLNQVNKQHLELITEIRALAIQVRSLHNIFVKRTVLWWVLGVETAIVVMAIVGLFVLASTNRSDTNALVNKLVESCQTRQQQVQGTNRFILDIERLQTQAYKHIPKQFQTPQEIRLEKEYTQALNRWKRSQPKVLPCERLR